MIELFQTMVRTLNKQTQFFCVLTVLIVLGALREAFLWFPLYRYIYNVSIRRHLHCPDCFSSMDDPDFPRTTFFCNQPDDVTDPRQGRGHTRDNPSLENATSLSSFSSLWIDLYLLQSDRIESDGQWGLICLLIMLHDSSYTAYHASQ